MEDMDIDDYSRDRSRSPVRNKSRSPPPRRESRDSSYSRGGDRRDRDYGRGSRGGRGGRGGHGGRGGRGGHGHRDRGDYYEGRGGRGRRENDRDYTSSRRDYVSKSVGASTSTADADDYRSKIERNYDNSIFIGNIPFDASAKDVEDIFRDSCQIVRADIVTNRGQSRGMATVEFSNKEDVHRAISNFDRYDYRGRQIFVRQDYPPPGEKRDRRDYTSSSRSERSTNERGGRESFREERPSRDSYKGLSYGGERQLQPREREHPLPGTEIFIGNLPFSVNWQALKDIMREAGEVVRADVRMDSWGRSRGFGTVVFKTEEEAAAAVEKFQGYVLEGRSLDARPGKVYNSERSGEGRSGDRDNHDGNGGSYRGADAGSRSAPEPAERNTEFTEGVSGNGERSNTIYAANLPWVTNVDDLYELFETIGRVTKAEIQFNDRGKPSGNAVVEFELEELADLAISNLNGYNYGGRDLNISYASKTFAPAQAEESAASAIPEQEVQQAEEEMAVEEDAAEAQTQEVAPQAEEQKPAEEVAEDMQA